MLNRLSYILLLFIVLCSFPEQSIAQPFALTVSKEEYVELSTRDYVVEDTSDLWNEWSYYVKLPFTFSAYGAFYDFNENVLTPLASGSILLQNYTTGVHIGACIGLRARTLKDQISEFSLKVDTETSPVRILKMQWKNMKPPTGRAQDYMNVQLWLYEDGRVDVRYGGWYMSEWGFGEDSGPTICIDPGNATLMEDWYLTGPAHSPSLINQSHACIIGMPDSGTVYQFYPVTGSVNQHVKAGSVTIFENSGYLTITPLPETATVRISNILGQTVKSQDIAPSVSLYIGDLPSGSYHVACLAGGKLLGSQMIVKR